MTRVDPGVQVSFYMRKGADCLSKYVVCFKRSRWLTELAPDDLRWVGEAERQLRLLFEQAAKTQVSSVPGSLCLACFPSKQLANLFIHRRILPVLIVCAAFDHLL